MSQQEEKLYEVLIAIEDELKKQNSMRRLFLYGLLRGLGTAIGATVLFAILTSSIFYFGETINLHEFMQNFINAFT